MTKEQAIKELRQLQKDLETARDNIDSVHVKADAILLDLIDDPEVSEAYNGIDKWYS